MKNKVVFNYLGRYNKISDFIFFAIIIISGIKT